MPRYEISESIRLVLRDGDVLQPSTVAGSYRVSHGGPEHNVRGEGERDVSEAEMIHAVLNQGARSRFRSTVPSGRPAANHFSVNSRAVAEVHVNVCGVWTRLR